MRRLGAGVLVAALLGVAAAGAGAQQPDGADKSPWWSSLTGHGDKANTPRVEEKPATERPGALPSPVERTARAQKREMNALLRRMEVCDRLLQIALDTNDTDLERQANELLDKARAVYEQRTARLTLAGKPDEAPPEAPAKAGRPRSAFGREDTRKEDRP
jgi:hypothetical protein